MQSPAVSLDQRDGVAVLTLAAPAWEPVGPLALAALARVCERLADDDAVQAVVLTGEGTRFTGDWAAAYRDDSAQAVSQCGAALELLAMLPQTVIAAVNGPAHGAGLELALAADIRLAAADATFLLAEDDSLPLGGGLTRLTRAVGKARAGWLALTGLALSADEALTAGLVSAVLPAADLLPEARRLAAVIAGRGPVAVRYAKEALQRGPELTLAQALRLETDLTVILQTTADRAEGVAAFKEKRAPRFTGE